MAAGMTSAACGAGSTGAANSPGTSTVGGAAGGPGAVDASGLPVHRPVLESDLRGQPGAHLYYPGSRLVSPVGADQTPTEPGQEPNPAYTGAILTVATTPARLYGWYSRQLAARGYVPTADYRPASQVSGKAWQRYHRVQVQVGVFDSTGHGVAAEGQGVAAAVPAGTLVYEEVIVGYPPGLPKA